MKFVTAFSLFAACVIAGSLQTTAQAQDPEIGASSKTTVSTRSFRYEMGLTDLKDTPAWDPESGEPPISASAAVRAARSSLGRYIGSPDKWIVRSIDLRSLRTDRWFYQIRFVCWGAECRNVKDHSFISIIKMDGTIVEPKRLVAVN